MVNIELIDLTRENWQAVAALTVSPEQEDFVASNLKTIAEVQFYPSSVCRVIATEGRPVGLAAYGIDTDDGSLWLFRFMISASEQGKGYGRAALVRLIETWRAMPIGCVCLAYDPDNVAAERLYQSLGFVPGDIGEHGDRIARLDLSAGR